MTYQMTPHMSSDMSSDMSFASTSCDMSSDMSSAICHPDRHAEFFFTDESVHVQLLMSSGDPEGVNQFIFKLINGNEIKLVQ